MRLPNVLIGVVALVVLLTLPAAAVIGQESPPSNPEVDQYFPTVPGDEGDLGVGGGGDNGSNDGGSLPPGTRKEVASEGPTGESAAAFFDGLGASARASGGGTGATPNARTGAASDTPGRATGSDGSAGTSAGAATDDSQSPVSPLVDSLVGDTDEGLGILLPVLLAAIAAGGIAVGLKRRDRRSARPG